MRGGSAPSAQSTSRGRHARPMKMSSSPDTSIATCTCARHTSTRQCPRGGAPPGLLGSCQRWSLVFSGGLDDDVEDEPALDVERPLDNRLPPCHTHTRTSESTVSDEHGQQKVRARAGHQRAVQRWARLEFQAYAAGAGMRVPQAGAQALRRGSSQWPGGHGGLPRPFERPIRRPAGRRTDFARGCDRYRRQATARDRDLGTGAPPRGTDRGREEPPRAVRSSIEALQSRNYTPELKS